MKPAEISSQSGKKPMFRHLSYGGARALAQPHVKTEAAAGGGRKASLYPEIASLTLSPLRRQNPREEPGALAALAGICRGGAGKLAFLP